MANYTHPNDKDYVDSKEDYLYMCLTFTRALGLLLKPDEGIIVEATNDIKHFVKSKNILVYKKGNQIALECSDKFDTFDDGQLIWLHDEN